MEEKKAFSFGSFIVAVLNGMAQGLFSSLIIGLIILQIGTYLGIDMLVSFGQIAQYMTGPAIGVGVAMSIKAPSLALFSSAASGAIGAGTISFASGAVSLTLGEPLGACIAALFGALAGKLISGRTKVDIILVPIATILIGGVVGVFISPAVSAMMNALGAFINSLTTLYPLFMGIMVSVVVGMVLTLPISSAAICISLGLSGLAAGAACAGCAAQMVGFAVMSFPENRWGGLVSQGIGTSMLQMGNIVRNPRISQGLGTSMLQIPNIWRNWRIWIPPTLASAVTGPISTCLFKLENNASGAGMGTSGLVGQFNAVAVMGAGCIPQVILLHFILPAVLSLVFSELMRKKGWIKDGDMKLLS